MFPFGSQRKRGASWGSHGRPLLRRRQPARPAAAQERIIADGLECLRAVLWRVIQPPTDAVHTNGHDRQDEEDCRGALGGGRI
jgi:hypothetical protein